ncbi:MAG TPA: MaoC family dehydratase [Streptosporangiaceae bacterium]
MKIYNGADELEASVGEELGPTEWLTIDQDRVNGFADVTEDHQWIHVDAERAAAGPFGGTIAHGFLTLSLLPHLTSALRGVEGVRMGVNYGLNKVRFPAPVRVGSRIRARAETVSAERTPDGAVQVVNRVTIEIEGGSKPACVADMVSRFYF